MRHRLSTVGVRRGSQRVSPTRFVLEQLESRRLLATIFTVTSVADSGTGTLRQAILDANTAGGGLIAFNISSGGYQSIQPLSPLPALGADITIDGSTQPGTVGTAPTIELDGASTGTGVDGLQLTGDDDVVNQLVINGFSGSGIQVTAGSGDQITGNYLGTDITGQSAQANHAYGLNVAGASSILIQNNVISGNYGPGVSIANSNNPALLGNDIGVNKNGAILLANIGDGLDVSNSPGTIIGDANGDGNVISGNEGAGVSITGSENCTLLGNDIGVDVTGAYVLANGNDGLDLNNSPGTTIGDNFEDGNVISGNGGAGVSITDSDKCSLGGDRIGVNNTELGVIPNGGDGLDVSGSTGVQIGAFGAGNVISGNTGAGVSISNNSANCSLLSNDIGVNSTGAFALPNGGDGVDVTNSPSAVIGANSEDGNVISSNRGAGVAINGSANCGLFGNDIGVDVTGEEPLPNVEFGLGVGDSPGTVIGDANGDGNVISGNGTEFLNEGGQGFPGITIDDSDNCSIQGNDVGVDKQGENIIANGSDGLDVAGSSGVVIGVPGTGNVISGNKGAGISLTNCDNASLLGNDIGVDVNGGTALPNTGDGVDLSQSLGSNIGDASSADGNVISGNKGAGVSITASDNSTLWGNLIGTDITTDSRIPNQSDGVTISDSSDATIAVNVISGNDGYGIYLEDNQTTDTLIYGNKIGVDFSGFIGVDNTDTGIFVDSSIGTTIGGSATGAGNVISGNHASGIAVTDATDTTILGNEIGTSTNGELGLGNFLSGIAVTDSAETVIGTEDPGGGNIIAANGENGILVEGFANTGTTIIRHNLIGTDMAGDDGLGNYLDGILLDAGGVVTIGGTSASDRNVISGNVLRGIDVEATSDNNLIEGNYIGTSPDGEEPLGNFAFGVILDTSGNTLGGTTPGAGNLISGNGADGVLISGGTNNSKNLIIGNKIGTDATGLNAIPNYESGIAFNAGASENTIGGSGKGMGNLIAGNLIAGISINNQATDNLVVGNKIGTDISGLLALPNGGDGIFLFSSAEGNTIGGTHPGDQNLISGNGGAGVHIALGSSNNSILGNHIGIDESGLNSIPNRGAGVLVEASKGNMIGEDTTGAENVLSGNSIGIELSGIGTDDTTILGNLIGTDPTGTEAISNTADGILIFNGSSNNTIGGTDALARNVISGNSNGINIIGPGSSANSIQGNDIGTNVSGTSPLPNKQVGIFISNSPKNIIGGSEKGARNVVSGNLSSGIYILDPASTQNMVYGNIVGLDVSGTVAVGNAGEGIRIVNAPGNTIGGAAPGLGNIVSGNSQAGVQIQGGNASRNVVSGNRIGTDVTGTFAIPNFGDGVFLNNAGSNTIGNATNSAGANLISGNIGSGIQVLGAAASLNAIVGNLIGTNVDGTSALGNHLNGVYLNDAPKNTVGGTAANAGNVIAGNQENGIEVHDVKATGTLVEGNKIGTDITGTKALGNQRDGILVDLANYTVIGQLIPHGANTIAGNGLNGIEIHGSSATGTEIQGNYIGTNLNGTTALGNPLGILINAAPGVIVGGNVISGNTQTKLSILGAGASATIQGNKIGTDATGKKPLPNNVGVLLTNVSGSLVGGTTPAAANVISANSQVGVQISGANATGNLVVGNDIGTDSTGTFAVIPPSSANNTGQQIGVFLDGAPDNTIGEAGGRNVISGNVIGIVISSASATGNVVQGNFIGTDVSGMKSVGNEDGIYINNAPGNLIGGLTSK